MRSAKCSTRVARPFLITIGCCLGVVVLAVAVVVLEPHFRTVPPTFEETAPGVGDSAPDFVLRDADGQAFHLAEHVREKPVVIEFGSLSCPYCAGQLDSMQELAEEYGERVQFLFVYTAEAHPQEAPLVTTWEERRQRAKIVQREVKGSMRVLVDDFGDGSVQKQYGSFANSGFVFGPDHRLIGKVNIATPQAIDNFLRKVVTAPAAAQ
jgi:thiol-disulfide isomerase/thioredoxin